MNVQSFRGERQTPARAMPLHYLPCRRSTKEGADRTDRDSDEHVRPPDRISEIVRFEVLTNRLSFVVLPLEAALLLRERADRDAQVAMPRPKVAGGDDEIRQVVPETGRGAVDVRLITLARGNPAEQNHRHVSDVV